MQNITFSGNNYVLFQDPQRNFLLFVVITRKSKSFFESLRPKKVGWILINSVETQARKEANASILFIKDEQESTISGDSITFMAQDTHLNFSKNIILMLPSLLSQTLNRWSGPVLQKKKRKARDFQRHQQGNCRSWNSITAEWHAKKHALSI